MPNSYLIKNKILSESNEHLDSTSLFNYLVNTQSDTEFKPELGIISENSACYSLVIQALAQLENHFDPFFGFTGYLESGNLLDFKHIKNRTQNQKDSILIADSMQVVEPFIEMSRSNRSRHTVINISPRAERVDGTNLINIGFSRHNTPKAILASMMNSQSVSIGEAKSNIQALEPLVRDAKFARINVNIIDSVIAGFTIFEVCALMKYLGHANNLDLVLIDGDKENDPRYYEKVALLLWYFLEGRQHRQNDYPQNPMNKSYLVYSTTMNQDFEFAKSEISGRWWLKNPGADNEYISVSFDEYTNIAEDNVPQRILELI